MRLLFALPGFHLFDRGAEVALLSVAAELAKKGDNVTVVGSGPPPRRSSLYVLSCSLCQARAVGIISQVPTLSLGNGMGGRDVCSRLTSSSSPEGIRCDRHMRFSVHALGVAQKGRAETREHFCHPKWRLACL